MDFRDLKANEIDVRISTVKANGISLLLYKDARCDMNILDETVGPTGWERSHQSIEGRLYCTVSIYDSMLEKWIKKQDVGTESYTEKEKGQASDSFKRACFNWGIGRELYTSPFIWIPSSKCDIKDFNGKKTCHDKFHISDIGIVDKKISKITIVNDSRNQVVFEWSDTQVKEQNNDTKKSNEVSKKVIGDEKLKVVNDLYKNKKMDCLKFFSENNIGDIKKMTEAQFVEFIKKIGD